MITKWIYNIVKNVTMTVQPGAIFTFQYPLVILKYEMKAFLLKLVKVFNISVITVKYGSAMVKVSAFTSSPDAGLLLPAGSLKEFLLILRDLSPKEISGK